MGDLVFQVAEGAVCMACVEYAGIPLILIKAGVYELLKRSGGCSRTRVATKASIKQAWEVFVSMETVHGNKTSRCLCIKSTMSVLGSFPHPCAAFVFSQFFSLPLWHSV